MAEKTPKMFGTEQEKEAYLRVHERNEIHALVSVPFPCTSQDCLNEAKAVSLVYRPARRCWEAIATCKVCVGKLFEMYGGE